MDRRLVLIGGLALMAAPAFAIDPGVASGRYTDDETEIVFTHAIAIERDNTEGLLEYAREIRIALTDREIPLSALLGQGFPPIWSMASEGRVRGVLLSLNPTDRTGMVVTVLDKPEPGYSLTNLSVSDSEGLWSRLDVASNRVIGETRPDAMEKLTANFSAPLFNDRVKADLKGPAAAASEPAQAVVARAEALIRGDMAAAAALSTEASAARLRTFPPEALAMIRRELPKVVDRMKSVRRVVIREQTAVIFLGPGEYANATREGGVWKVAD